MSIPAMPVTLTVAAGAALINIWLQTRIIRVRLSEKILVGEGGNDIMARRMRAHLNFAENAPIVLILLALVEWALGGGPWLWAAGAAFLVARVLHPIGMDGWLPGRQAGMILTLLVTLALVGAALWAAWMV